MGGVEVEVQRGRSCPAESGRRSCGPGRAQRRHVLLEVVVASGRRRLVGGVEVVFGRLELVVAAHASDRG